MLGVSRPDLLRRLLRGVRGSRSHEAGRRPKCHRRGRRSRGEVACIRWCEPCGFFLKRGRCSRQSQDWRPNRTTWFRGAGDCGAAIKWPDWPKNAQDRRACRSGTKAFVQAAAARLSPRAVHKRLPKRGWLCPLVALSLLSSLLCACRRCRLCGVFRPLSGVCCWGVTSLRLEVAPRPSPRAWLLAKTKVVGCGEPGSCFSCDPRVRAKAPPRRAVASFRPALRRRNLGALRSMVPVRYQYVCCAENIR